MFFKYIKKYIGKYKWYFWSGFGALAITDCLDVVPPLIVMRGVDQIKAHAGRDELFKTAVLFAVLTVALALIRFHWRMQFGKFHQNVAKDLRQEVFAKLTELNPHFYSENPTGELMSLITNDVEAIRMGMGPGLVVLSDSLFYFLTIPPIMFSLSVSLTLKSLVLLPVLPFFMSWLGGIINRRFLVEQEKFSELSGFVQENIAGIRTVKGYVQEQNQARLFDGGNSGLKNATQRVAFAETFFHPVMEFCVSVGVVALIYFGTDDVIRGAITVGTFVAFQRYISKMVWPMTAVGWGYSLISQASASLKRVEELLATQPEVVGGTETLNAQAAPLIKLTNLSFKYPDHEHWALKDVSLEIQPGEMLGIIGSVASGKTTLVGLLSHLYKVDRGMIYFSGKDINDLALESLRNSVTLVPQDPFLFSATIEENIKYGVSRVVSDVEMRGAARVAKIDSEITAIPTGYAAMLGERGINLSGGQKQRLTISRGILRQTPVIIFDDSVSAVDTETEKSILRNISASGLGQTKIIVSHKMSSLNQCDRILALKDGRVEAIGTVAEMKVKSQVYKTLLEHQNDPIPS